MNEKDRDKLVAQTVDAVLAAIPGKQERDRVAFCLQEKYGAWWIDPTRLLGASEAP